MRQDLDEKTKFDSKDKKIIEQLQKNCRQTIAQIAKKTKLPRDVVVYRIKKLEKSNVIRAHHTMLDPIKLGYPLYTWVLFACYNIEPEQEKKLITFLNSNKNIIYVSKCSGKYDFCIGICAKNYKQYDGIIREIRLKFANTIREIESVPTIQEFKYDWMVDLI
ncbi:MAG: Lrp/AsnC family transcriptional regulator [Nanoarchaeota archaeon]|nr:Lrp/AsnC family transcriptional regulator [Nanoarchaeota archaeon]MBU1322320.1 Lrp/AsnC family transcriptional regulator [Nanoarchaeota archaeon]MBU1597859.1 Lrp/AsnC family transcriptional regulator [Nanoarchaeota archaeon]